MNFSNKEDQFHTYKSHIKLTEQKKGERIRTSVPLRKKCISEKENENDKQTVNDSHHVACFDLQTALPTVTGDISNCSYKSKHSTYNGTLCDRQMEALCDVHCYLWH